MEKIISLKLDDDGKWEIPASVCLGSTYENLVTKLQIEIPATLSGWNHYLDFLKPNFVRVSSTPLEAILDGDKLTITFDVSSGLIDQHGKYFIDYVGRLDNKVWKSKTTLSAVVEKSINAVENISIVHLDFISVTISKIEEILDRVDEIGVDNLTHINLGYLDSITEYGVRFISGQSSPTGERVKRIRNDLYVGADTNLTANIGIDNQVVTNTFDTVSIFNRDIVQDGENTFVKVNKYYIKEEMLSHDGIDYEYLWMCESKLPGYRLPLNFKNEDGSENDFYLIGRYEGFIDVDGKLKSKSNVFPTVNTTRNSFRIAARKNDGDGTNIESRYQITDLSEYVDLVQIPMQIEFATKHMQAVMSGFTAGQYSSSHLPLIVENGVNRVVLTNAQGSLYRVGQTIWIGTSQGSFNVAKDRIILAIEVDTPSAGQIAILFDGDPVNIVTTHVVINASMRTGQTNNVQASSGCYLANDGKYSIVWRGIENPYGNIYKFVDGVKLSNGKAFICTKPSGYNDNSSIDGEYPYPFEKILYTPAGTEGYVKKLGFDNRFPFAKLPIEVGAGSTTYYSDYYYINVSGDRTVLVGGSWVSGATAGPFYWHVHTSLADTSLNLGCRLSKKP